MPTPENPLPDIAVGRHPDFGIVATNPKDLAASAWMLRGFDFHPVPGQPGLYALADQQRDGRERATRAVDLLRRANYRVEVDAEFDTFPAASGPVPAAATMPRRFEPEVAFAEHPRLGIVAATTDGVVLGGQFLEEHGWRHNPGLDIYTLPITTGRDQALGQVAPRPPWRCTGPVSRWPCSPPSPGTSPRTARPHHPRQRAKNAARTPLRTGFPP